MLELNSKVLESELNRKHINPTHYHGALSSYLSCHLHCGLHLLSHSTIHNPHNVLRITYYVLHVDIEFAELPTHPHHQKFHVWLRFLMRQLHFSWLSLSLSISISLSLSLCLSSSPLLLGIPLTLLLNGAAYCILLFTFAFSLR